MHAGRGAAGVAPALHWASPMPATAHARRPLGAPRLVLDCPAGPRARLRAWEADAAPIAAYRPSAHPTVELAWIEEGAVVYGIGRTRHDVGVGAAMLVPSDVEHATLFPTSMRGAALWIDRDVVAEIADAVGRRHGVSSGTIPDSARLAALGRALAGEVREGGAGAILAADAIVEAMVVVALRAESKERTPSDPAIAAAVRLIHAKYMDEIGVDAMARAAKMSRFHFSRRFREVTGKSPYRYLVDARLERAAELLRRGHANVTQAAIDVGFSDPSRFARMFRARFGAPPRRYADERRVRLVTSAR